MTTTATDPALQAARDAIIPPAVTADLTTYHGELTAALTAFGVIGSKPIVPVMGCVRFDPAGRFCEMFDYEVHVRYALDGPVSRGEPFLLSRDALAKFVKSFTVGSTARKVADTWIGIDRAGTTVTVGGDGYLYTAKDQPSAEDYPATPEPENPITFTLPRDALAGAVDNVGFAAGKDDTLPMLTGIMFDGTEPGKVRYAATDRFRLTNATAWTGHTKPFTALVPAATLAKVVKILPFGFVKVSVWGAQKGEVLHRNIRFTAGPVTVNVRTLDCEFVKYGRLFPNRDDLTLVAEVDAAALRTTIDRACAIGGDPKHQRMTLFFDGTTVQVTSKSNYDDLEGSGKPLPYQSEATPEGGLLIGFTPRYFTEGLARFPGKVWLGATTANKPFVMAETPDALGDADAYRYLVMPQHL